MDGDDAIAIVGIGCRFPGADNIDEYWKLLVNAECHLKEIPKERFNVDAFYDEDPSVLGKTYVRKAALIENPFHWDNKFFGYNENEAAAMDPQQRYVLDCVHMAMEDGGLTKKEMNGSSTSVYIGAMNADYQMSVTDDETLLSNYSVTGQSQSIMSARVSYLYNLLRPSMTIDTACSSALVAIHQGSESIKSGESTMAICGGVSSILYPEMFITLSRARMASPTGLCQAFSANADGYARGEGCGIVILEKYSNAKRNGHKIWGTVQTGCNQDGQTTRPITAPSGLQQMKLMETIYSKNNIDASHVQYIEAHGTGTPVGDPIESSSLGEFFKAKQVETAINGNNRMIGSVKTNIGHLESAAGIAGLIKVLLMMEHGQVVPSLHAEELNPRIDFEDYKFHIPKQVYPWYPIRNQFRMACINCFGFGGTNSHAVVKRDESSHINSTTRYFQDPVIITLSAQTPTSLRQLITKFQINIKNERQNLLDIAYTSTLRRDHFRYRVAYSVKTDLELSSKCSESIEKLDTHLSKTGNKKQIFFVFCGVGTSWTGMCREMLSNSIFEDALLEIDNHLEKLAGWSIKEKLSNQEDMKNPILCHISIFACQVGLAKVWESFGIIPDALVGQSVGEVATAYIAGSLTLKDAVHVIYFRSLLLSMAEGGKMMVVRNCNVDLVKKICDSLKSGSANVAVHSSPIACTVSGDATAIDELKANLADRHESNQPICTFLDVKCAYHSHHVQQIGDKVTKALKDIEIKKPNMTVYSTVTGDVASPEIFATKEYWGENVKSEVKFSSAIRKMSSDTGVNIFIEVGPKPVLRAHINDILSDTVCFVLPSMHPSGEKVTLYQSVANLYELGVDPKWEMLNPINCNLVDIPRYEFERYELRVESDYRRLKSDGIKNQSCKQTLLKANSKSSEHFKVKLSPGITPFIYNHIIDGTIVVPGALYTEIALELGKLTMLANTENLTISYDILSFVPVVQGKPCDLEVRVINRLHDSIDFSISHNNNLIVRGSILIQKTKFSANHCPIDQIMSSCRKIVEADNIYHDLERCGYRYESPVQVLNKLMFNESECLAEINLTDEIQKTVNQYILHPAILDGMMHPLLLLFMKDCEDSKLTRIFPTRIGRLVFKSHLEQKMLCYSRKIKDADNIISSNYLLTDMNGSVIMEVNEMEFKVINGTNPFHSIVYDVMWKPFENGLLGTSTPLNDREILVISLQENVLMKMKGMFPESRSVHVKYDPNDDASLQDTITLFGSILEDNHLSLLVFATGNENYKTNKETFDAIRISCHVLLAILKSCNPHNSLLILTENTQNLPGTDIKNQNFLGAELWGYTRSARIESNHLIFLLDLQTQSTNGNELLKSFVKGIRDIFESQNGTDFVLAGEQFHYFAFVENSTKKRTQMHEFKETEIDDSRHVELRSTKHNVLEKPFLIPHEKPKNEKGVLLHLQTVTNLQVVPFDKNCHRGIWSESQDSGYTVLTLEYCGVKCDDKLLVSNSSECRKYAVCYPNKCSSVVAVPNECICDLQRIKFYKPGILTAFIIAWSIFQTVKRTLSVCIIDNESNPNPETIILIEIMKQRNMNVTLQSPEKFLADHNANEGTIIFQTADMLEEICMKVKNVEKIIAFSDVISEPINKVFIMQNNEVTLLYKTEIFHPKTLKSTLPTIRSFMEKHPNIVQKASPYIKANAIQMTSSATGHPNRDLRLHLKPRQMIHRNASYIVVGGLTGLGWEVVKWLAKMGAGLVVTLSRRKPDKDTVERIKNVVYINHMKIITLQCDVCCLDSVRAAVKKISKDTGLPVKGVYQGAGILRDGYISGMTKEKIDDVLLPKVLGTLNLHEATLHLPLDQFVLQSSIASVLGSPGQTSYSAANSFLDAFAYYRRSQNLPCQSLNWGALDVGMVGNNASVKEQLQRMGHNPLNRRQIKLSLSDAIVKSQTQIIYASIDFGKSGITNQTKKVNRKKMNSSDQNNSTIFDALSFGHSTTEEKIQHTLDVIITSIAKILSLEKSEIEPENSLINHGLESQQATELIQTVYETTGCKLPIAYIISPQYSVRDIAEFAAAQITESLTNKEDEPIEKRKKTISSLEKTMIDIMQSRSDHQLFFELEVTKFAMNEDAWKAVLRLLTLRHPELRTLFISGKDRFVNEVEKNVLEAEDSALNFETLNIDKGNKFDNSMEVESKYPYTFGQFDLPLKLCYYLEGKKNFLQIHFHPFTFDLESCLLLTMEMCHIADDISDKRCLPHMNELKVINQPAVFDKKIDEMGSDMKTFWKSQISSVQKAAVLSQSKSSSSNELVTKTRHLSTIKKRLIVGEDSCKLICCLYGLLLSKVTSTPVVPIIVSTNVRQHFQDLNNRIFMGTNFIPVLFANNSDNDLRDYVNSALAKYEESGEFSLYPYELIQALKDFKQQIFRHQFVSNTTPCEIRGCKIKTSSVTVPTLNGMETCLTVSNNICKESVELHLTFSKGQLDNGLAERLLEDLENLIVMYIKNPRTLVKDYTPQTTCQGESVIPDVTEITAL